ncbi:MAG: hypothetical protein KatS3mg099_044 [Candidatus Parcubacteria bacterium]|nr:MAG: hypothetical protein KatS3mg099_044 [Candidatus Parcubacteria bacterium]
MVPRGVMVGVIVFAAFLGGLAGGALALAVAQPDSAVISRLEERIQALEETAANFSQEMTALKEELAQATNRSRELLERAIARNKSEDERLVEAVAKVAPAVVSIVATKEVPRLRVEYVNPFGDDPFFRDFGIRIPVYRQEGTVRQKVGAGTGFIVSRTGIILTNRHVVADPQASYVALLSDGSQVPLRVLYRDPKWDLAVARIEGEHGAPYPTAPLGTATTLRLGERVAVIGNALGEYSNSVTTGIISGLNRRVVAHDASGNAAELTGVIQTDAAINPGNSGGPLINLDGEVVGIATATVLGSENIGFAIPIDEARVVLQRLFRGEFVPGQI